jgi:hypothetical protein
MHGEDYNSSDPPSRSRPSRKHPPSALQARLAPKRQQSTRQAPHKGRAILLIGMILLRTFAAHLTTRSAACVKGIQSVSSRINAESGLRSKTGFGVEPTGTFVTMSPTGLQPAGSTGSLYRPTRRSLCGAVPIVSCHLLVVGQSEFKVQALACSFRRMNVRSKLKLEL